MEKYIKFEEQRIREVKIGFTTVHDAMERCTGYICCMRDMEVISVDRAGEETINMIRKFLKLERKMLQRVIDELEPEDEDDEW